MAPDADSNESSKEENSQGGPCHLDSVHAVAPLRVALTLSEPEPAGATSLGLPGSDEGFRRPFYARRHVMEGWNP